MKRLLLFLTVVLCCSSAYSQLGDIEAVAEDLIFLTNKYITPAANASVYQASGGWYTSAKPKKKYEVEFSLQYNVLLIPNNQKMVLINEAELQNITIHGGSNSAQIPTALGNDDTVVLQGEINDEVFEFDAPEGINSNIVQHGQIQATIGLWKKTSFIARFAPNIKINNTNYRSLGFGLMHNLSQWMPFIKESRFKVSFLGTYSNYLVDDKFNKADLRIGVINSIKVNGESYGFNVITSRTIKSFDFSLGLGLTSSKFDYEVGGEGELLLTILNNGLGTLSSSKTNFKTDLSVNYNWRRFSVNTMLTLGDYSNLNFGLNYSFI